MISKLKADEKKLIYSINPLKHAWSRGLANNSAINHKQRKIKMIKIVFSICNLRIFSMKTTFFIAYKAF